MLSSMFAAVIVFATITLVLRVFLWLIMKIFRASNECSEAVMRATPTLIFVATIFLVILTGILFG
jgi:formate-dependent nitrite reductase membrane component NrfD